MLAFFTGLYFGFFTYSEEEPYALGNFFWALAWFIMLCFGIARARKRYRNSVMADADLSFARVYAQEIVLEDDYLVMEPEQYRQFPDILCPQPLCGDNEGVYECPYTGHPISYSFSPDGQRLAWRVRLTLGEVYAVFRDIDRWVPNPDTGEPEPRDIRAAQSDVVIATGYTLEDGRRNLWPITERQFNKISAMKERLDRLRARAKALKDNSR